ncbi:MAG: hypothetical protein P8J27_10740 [Mariniblastus sp.]|nr:hypothetical protein [Mariniblastus sp.]
MQAVRCFWPHLFLLFCLTGLTGCGGVSTYPVTGTLEFKDGDPVKFGTIEFFNRESKLNARGEISRDGSFSMQTFKENDGAIAGVHAVTIQQFTTLPLTANQNVKIKHDHGKLVADKYKSYATSDLIVTVEKQDNSFKLIVDSKD